VQADLKRIKGLPGRSRIRAGPQLLAVQLLRLVSQPWLSEYGARSAQGGAADAKSWLPLLSFFSSPSSSWSSNGRCRQTGGVGSKKSRQKHTAEVEKGLFQMTGDVDLLCLCLHRR
jgi:hypothetical protein